MEERIEERVEPETGAEAWWVEARRHARLERRKRGGRGLSGAIILIGLGVALLLNNLGIMSFDVSALLRFWPVLLILFGLDMILGRRSVVGNMLVAILGLAIMAGVLWFVRAPATGPVGLFPSRAGAVASDSFDFPLGDTEALEVELRLGAMDVEVAAGSEAAIAGDYITDARLVPQINHRLPAGVGQLEIIQPDRKVPFGIDSHVDSSLRLDLPPGVPIDLLVNSDFGRVSLDLTDLDVQTLTVNAGSGQVVVTLPRSGTLSEIDVESDFGAVTVEAPRDSDLAIDWLLVNSGSGEVRVTLPARGRLDDVEVRTDFGAVTLDVAGDPADLSIAALDISTGSGEIVATLPGRGDYEADLETDFGAVTVVVPDSLEARLELDSDFGGLSTDDRFKEMDGDVWETERYERASDRVLIAVSTGTGGVVIK